MLMLNNIVLKIQLFILFYARALGNQFLTTPASAQISTSLVVHYGTYDDKNVMTGY